MMGFEIQDIRKIKEIQDKYKASWDKIAILGDCKFYFSWDELEGGRKEEFTLESLKEYLGASEVQTFDLFGHPTVVQDLHNEFEEKFKNYFDIVLDAGTMFCCFDVSKVWQNVFSLIKIDGYIWHLAGLTGYFGRSYYSFHPMLFRDFYVTNEFEILNMGVRHRSQYQQKKYFWKSKKNNYLDWVDLKMNDVFYKGFNDRGKLIFHEFNTKKFDLIYNDSIVSCFVKCKGIKNFRRAIPSYYSDPNL